MKESYYRESRERRNDRKEWTDKMMEVSKKVSEKIAEKKGETTKNERKRKMSKSSNEESGIKTVTFY